MTAYMTDADDFCRQCRGSGQIKEITERDTTLYDRCEFCGGSGLRSVSVTERAHSDARMAGGDCPQAASPIPAGHFNHIEAQWITDTLLPTYYDTGWDRMRWIERMQELNVHDFDLRSLRADDYLTAKYDQRDFRHAAMFVCAAILSTLIAFAAIAAP